MNIPLKTICSVFVGGVLFAQVAQADYHKGDLMFQVYGGGAALAGRYDQPGVSHDDEQYADGAGVVGGQILYFIQDVPCLAVGADISHAGFTSFISNRMLTNRLTDSEATSTSGLGIVRLSYPKGRLRPYIQGGLGIHHTKLHLNAVPINGSTWSDTHSTEIRTLVDDGHVGPAVEGAIGMYVYLTERFFLGGEYKWIGLFGKNFAVNPAGRLEGVNPNHGSVGEAALGFTIGYGF